MLVKKLVLVFIIWRLFLSLASLLGFYTLPFKDSFPYRDSVLIKYGHPLFYSWANFDGVHYLGIADKGYFAQFTQAFFPVYPLLVGALGRIIDNYLIAGLLISHVCFFVSLYLLYELVRLDFSKRIAWKTILLLLAFPTSFYFGAVYTESLFLMLLVACLYAIRKGYQMEAVALAAIASGTRIIGIFLMFSLFYEKFIEIKHKFLNLKIILSVASLFLSSIGLLLYMWYLDVHFSDPLYFLNAQEAFGAERSSDKFILLYQVIYRYIKIFLTIDLTSLLAYTVSQEFFSSILFLGLLLWGFWAKVRPSYLIFSLLAFILPTLTGTFSSMSRYVVILFPAFIVLAAKVPEKIYRILFIVFLILLFINTLLFTRGYWIA